MTAIADRPLTAGTGPDPFEQVRRAADLARDHLLALQDPAGWWKGELATNVTMDAEDLLLREFLGIRTSQESEAAARWIRSQQRDDGTWANFHGGPPDLSTTVEAYVALRLVGDRRGEPHLALAARWIQANGGVERTRVFTRIWLAMFGLWPWEQLPVLPPELIFLPASVPFNVYDWACWARQTMVPLTIVSHFRPCRPVRFGIDELRTGAQPEPFAAPTTAAGFFQRADRVLRRYERLRRKPGRRAALLRATEWIIARQESDGGWGGIQPPWVYSLIALHLMGYRLDHPVMRAGIEGLEGFLVRQETSQGPIRRVEACQSPVWDTALAMIALTDAGVAGNHPALTRAADWLLDEEITVRGDWAVRRPDVPAGGWAFEFANDFYPDTDDTAEIVLALRRAADAADGARLSALDAALDRAMIWLSGMQSRDGGWGAFDADNTRTLITKLPFCDFGAVIDPPSSDVTAHIVEAYAAEGLARHPRALRGVRWLLEHQEPDGSWFGRWGANHVYGTGASVPALIAAGVARDHPAVRRAVRWLIGHQNDDGGWGEDLRSYRDKTWIGRGDSTPSQTGWAMLALLAADGSGGDERDAAARSACDRGAMYLARTQRADGSWDEEPFTGTGFPGDFYINYHLYRLVFPLTALGRHLAARTGAPGARIGAGVRADPRAEVGSARTPGIEIYAPADPCGAEGVR